VVSRRCEGRRDWAGPHRDAQIAKLVREGVPVSPAGIVQDMARVAVTTVEARDRESFESLASEPVQTPAAPLSRSRGMKDRPA
jgi:methylated-DNA-protein-cysteine methyltransferase-like protein